MARFGLSELQAKAILDMKLQRLTGLEVEKVREEHRETLALIERLKAILASEQEVLAIVRDELVALRDRYGDDRRTEIAVDEAELDVEDLVPNDRVVVSITSSSYVKRQDIDSWQVQRRGGKGLRGQMLKEEDHVEELSITRNHNYLLWFTNLGRVYKLKAFRVPESGRQAKGVPIVNLLPEVMPGERVVAFRSIEQFDDRHYVIFATRRGEVKRTRLDEFMNIRTTGIRALNIDEGDALVSVRISDGDQDVVLATKLGQSIRFAESELQPHGRNAGGVRGIRVRDGDELVSMALTNEGSDVLTVTQNGYGKRSALADYPQQARGGSGVRTIITSDRNGPVVSVRLVSDTDELMIATVKGMVIRIPVLESEANQVRVMGRATQGVRLIRLAEGDRVVCVGVLTKAEDEATANGNGRPGAEGEGAGEGGGVTVEATHVASIASAGPEKDIDEGAGEDEEEEEEEGKGKGAGGQGTTPAA